MRFFWFFILITLFFACQRADPQGAGKRFTSLSAAQTGIAFRNDVPYTDSFNCYLFRNFYNGGGVGIGDVNNDGLPDVFFCGNMTSNRLYLNRGNFQFEDVTEKAGLRSKNIWTAGVAFVDVNGDGWLDIYTCKSGQPGGEKRSNELFINNGTSGTFTERAAEYGLNSSGLSTHAAFLDYDHDGDLDCYLLNNSIRSVGGYDYRPGQRNTPDPNGGNKLLRNNQDQRSAAEPPLPFTDVTQQAGIYASAIGFGLGVTVGDYDQDGWPDLFISNDFFERDYLYRNKGDGTFEEVLEKTIPEISKGAMGADMADLDNDGFPEIFVTEMTPPDDARYKTKAAFDNWNTYQLMTHTGYHRQFGRNMLQHNNGDGTFSEIGRQAGTWATDWSWGALLADFDNDGFKDVFVANGIGKDLLDQDYVNFYSDPAEISKIIKENPGQGIKKLIDAMPSEPIANYLFHNNGDLTFSNQAANWGLDQPSFSNGSAYADLDNDGDLDLVVNNVNMPCFVYRNETNSAANYLTVNLKGEGNNPFAIGAKAVVKAGENTYYQELAPMRGFESCVDYRLHFGLGSHQTLESVEVTFPSGKIWRGQNVTVNQILQVAESNATDAVPEIKKAPVATLFTPDKAPTFQHQENDWSDFDREPLLFRMYSAEGPKLATADINGDGLTDFYIGGAAGQAGKLFIQTAGGDFTATQQPDFEHDKACEDVTATFFDADGDGDADLYVGSGSNEFNPGDEALQDRLYLNDGRGHFKRNTNALPNGKPFATACARAADVDGDGDLDVFVGMRLVPGHYGQAPTSFLLENDGKGNFKPNFQKYAVLGKLGMVTDAAWTDVDGDTKPDLIVVGEWEPVRIFKNDGDHLTEMPAIPNSNGWWNCLSVSDLDSDGDPDVVLGNWGENTRFKASPAQPLSLYIHDFDQNGTDETILCQYNGDKSYPLVLRNDLVKQMPSLKKKYLQFASYKNQTITDIFTPQQLAGVQKKEVNLLKSSVLWNKGNGNFELMPLPYAAQQTPVFAIAVADFTGDGRTDIVLAGNHERCKPEVGVYLGSYGCVLAGDGKGNFTLISPRTSGLKIPGVVRDFGIIQTKKGRKLLVARNNAALEVWKTTGK